MAPDDQPISVHLCTIELSSSTAKPAAVTLNLCSSSIDDVSSLSGFTSLQLLDISCNQVATLTPLTVLEQLRSLNASRNRLTTFPEFGGGDNDDAYPRLLMKVDLSFNAIHSIGAAIANYKYLTELNLKSNSLTSLQWCHFLRHLQALDVADNHIDDLAGLPSDGVLVTLDVSHNVLVSLSVVDPVPSLRYLTAGRNQIADVDAIAMNFPNLAVLDLGVNAITSLTALTDLSQLQLLRDLNLLGNAVVGSDHYRADLVFFLSDLGRLDDEPITDLEKLQSEIVHGEHEDALKRIDDPSLYSNSSPGY